MYIFNSFVDKNEDSTTICRKVDYGTKVSLIIYFDFCLKGVYGKNNLVQGKPEFSICRGNQNLVQGKPELKQMLIVDKHFCEK